MAEELAEFNEKTQTQDSLYEELRRMDARTKLSTDDAEIQKRR